MNGDYPLVICYMAIEKWPIYFFVIYLLDMVIFHMLVYQRVRDLGDVKWIDMALIEILASLSNPIYSNLILSCLSIQL
jgi:hypothetical protein